MKLLKALFFTIFLSLALNAQDKFNEEVINNIYENVILQDVKNTQATLKMLNKTIEKKDLKASQKEFKNLVYSWKQVEAMYILGDLDDNYIDIPRYIDIFHNANEDIKEQIDIALNSKDEIKIALFKNSLKSINALEYLLFKKDFENQRVVEASKIVVNKISIYMDEIYEEYKNQQKTVTSNLPKMNGIIVNKLIETTYKLKEWRIGEVAGLTKKYKDKASNERGEYYISKSSAIAIKAILDNFKRLLDSDDKNDLGDFLEEATHSKLLVNLKKSVNDAIKLITEIKNDDLTKASNLYEEVGKIHTILFVEMIEELQINAKILDADGD